MKIVLVQLRMHRGPACFHTERHPRIRVADLRTRDTMECYICLVRTEVNVNVKQEREAYLNESLLTSFRIDIPGMLNKNVE